MRPTVTTIESNLKGGVSLDLAPRTLILGPNGAGKDAILNTVALALTGIADDVLGRDAVKDPALIGTLGDATGVRAVARLSTGTLCEYETTRTPDGTAKKPTARNTYPDAYPLRAVRDALTAGADKARAFLLAQVAGTITDDDVTAALPVERVASYRTLAERALGASPVDRLLSVHATAKKRGADAATQAEGVEQSIRRTADTLGPEPLSADVEAARARIGAVATQVASAMALGKLRELHAAANDAVIAFQNAKAEAARLREHAGPDADLAVARVVQMDALRTSARWHVERNMHACALCGSASDAFADRLADIAHAHGVWEQRASAGMAAQAADERVARLRAQAIAAVDAFDRVGGASALNNAVDPVAVQAEYEAASREYARIQSAAGAWATLRGFRTQQADLLDESREMKALREATTDAIANLLDRAADTFAARVQRYLPASDAFALRLRDGDREVCRFGFLRDGALHSALSGAEWARCLLAIAAAVAEGANADHPIVLVPPERAFDPATLAAVMAALSDAPGQVLLASPVAPSYVPAGWTILTVGDGSIQIPTQDAAPEEAEKPKRKRRTKAEMEAARAAEAATPTADVQELTAALVALTDDEPASDAAPIAGPWFDASALTQEAAPVIVATTPTVARYAKDENADEVAAFFARLRGVAEAK